MEVPSLTHPRWAEILLGTFAVQVRFLGLRLILGRLKSSVAATPASLPAAVKELREFFDAVRHIPSIQTDLEALFR
jgi:hypothetical protein